MEKFIHQDVVNLVVVYLPIGQAAYQLLESSKIIIWKAQGVPQ